MGSTWKQGSENGKSTLPYGARRPLPRSQKRGDTLVGTLRKTYGPEFAPGVRSDVRLDTLRERTGGSLTRMLKRR